MTNSKAVCAASEQTPQVRKHNIFKDLEFILDGGEENKETMQRQEEDKKREDNTTAGKEETTFTTNTEVSHYMCNGHHI